VRLRALLVLSYGLFNPSIYTEGQEKSKQKTEGTEEKRQKEEDGTALRAILPLSARVNLVELPKGKGGVCAFRVFDKSSCRASHAWP
jgi:hypothetical protein